MTATFYVGDAIETMNALPAKSVDLILTSPPFLALRSYLPQDHPDKALEGGSQSTPGEYIDWLLDVVDACARVLAPHGSLVFELGDTYAGSGGAGGDYKPGGWREGQEGFKQNYKDRVHDGVSKVGIYNLDGYTPPGGKGWPQAKSLSLIPESFRWAMVYGRNPFTGRTCDTWRLRNVIRWVRPNPPVGALGDKFRPATSELMVFCKAKDRFFDLDAVRTEPLTDSTIRNGRARFPGEPGNERHVFDGSNPAGAPPLDWWNIPLLDGDEETRYGRGEKAQKSTRTVSAKAASGDYQFRNRGGYSEKGDLWENHPLGTPPLDWWNIPPGGYSGAHYAVFPPELLIKPVKAMCPEKVCRTCGEPSRRIVEQTEDYAEFRQAAKTMRKDPGMEGAGKGQGGLAGSGYNRDPHGVALGSPTAIHRSGEKYLTTGWTDCSHDDWRPGLVLDCFGGSGTTAVVATGHGRDCILIDLDERNYDLALERVGPFILERGEIE